MKLFVNGRKSVFNYLEKNIDPKDKIIWLHAASLGEYEQGVPILEALKTTYPNHKFLVTFFSPSGYEVKKESKLPDYVTYLPLDTKKNAQRFLTLVQPEIALFVKYEIWPNYLKILKEKGIPAVLISGIFRESQPYFNQFLGFMKKALQSFEHLFVQDKASLEVLKKNEFEQGSISGDTRFDRVYQQLSLENQLAFMEAFKDDKLCLVCGSTWPEDENLLIDFINLSSADLKFVIAPHQIRASQIDSLQKKLKKSVVRYSEIENKTLKDFSILIVDTVGLLSKIYAYADIAYVGGAAGNTGLHNILEPATFGIPIIIGKNHHKFPEASLLDEAGGLYVAENQNECTEILTELSTNEQKRLHSGKCSEAFILRHKGATKIILEHLNTLISS